MDQQATTRLTPEQIIAAYEAAGVWPCNERYFDYDGRVTYTCPQTALYLAAHPDIDIRSLRRVFDDPDSTTDFVDAMQLWLGTALGVSSTYLSGFACGVDEEELDPDFGYEPEWAAGFADGRAAYCAVAAKYYL